MTEHPTNLEIVLEDAKILENRASRDALLEAVTASHTPSKEKLLQALDELPWQPHFFDFLRHALAKKEPVESICLQAFAGPAFLPAFLEIGLGLHVLSQNFHEVRPLAVQNGLFENDLTWRYIKNNWDMLLHVFASMRGGRFFGLPDYDPRRMLENNGGALYEEQVGASTLRAIYTPTPTIGNRIAPELIGCLEALKKKKPYSAFSYVNLQNISSHDEGYRVRALMELNEQFPGIFFGITLTQDSRFYRDKEAPANTLKEELCNPCNFTLENRIRKNDPGYYFPGGFEKWEKVLLKIIDRAYEITQDKSAFVELVHLGIIRHHQMSCLKNGSILSTVACKESIDRGGKVNAELFWALTEESEKMNLIVFSMFHARALLTRKRLILGFRSNEMNSLMQHVTRKEAHMFLHDISNEFQVDSPKIRLL